MSSTFVKLFSPTEEPEAGMLFERWLAGENGQDLDWYRGLSTDAKEELNRKFARWCGLTYEVEVPGPNAKLGPFAKLLAACALLVLGWMLVEGFFRAIGAP